MNDIFEFADELGPTKVLHVYEPVVGLKGVLVVDNVALGPAIGGIRMAPDVSAVECFRLARGMSLKNSAAGLSHGGGKAVLYGDPKLPLEKKERLIRAFAASLRDISEYIPAPDMGTDEQCMAWIKDEMGRVVGLPREIGGIPLDEIGATAWGLFHAIDVAVKYCDFELESARVVIQGFGSVGKHAARFLAERNVVLVGVADSEGAIYDSSGFDVQRLLELKESGKSVTEYPGAKKLGLEAIIDLDCDIWIPAARPDVINEVNMGRLKAKLVAPGANIAVTDGAEKYLHENGVLCLPDFIANAGGVICAAMEYSGANESAVYQTIQEKVSHNTREILKLSKERGVLPKRAAVDFAVERIKKAMSYRRWSVF